MPRKIQLALALAILIMISVITRNKCNCLSGSKLIIQFRRHG